MRKILISVSLLGLVPFVVGCSILEDSYVDRKLTDLDKRISKIEADMLTVKFKLGLIDYDELLGKKSDETSETKTDETGDENASVEESDENEEGAQENNDVDEGGEENNDVDEDAKDDHLVEITKPLEGTSFSSQPILFEGKVSEGAKKIVVSAEGSGYDDKYELQNFKEGDTDFWYKAATNFNNLAKGENTFVFEAFFDEDEKRRATITIQYL